VRPLFKSFQRFYYSKIKSVSGIELGGQHYCIVPVDGCKKITNYSTDLGFM
jgi:hypothetical protein